MSQILDQSGQPIQSKLLNETQTAQISALTNQFLTPMLGGLTPARLARILQEADQGNLIDQHRLFADMEERDGHIQAEMSKRKNAVVSLSWNIVPPRNATANEKADAEWVREMLTDAVDPLEDALLGMMDGVGHGFAPIELEWRKEGGELLPAFHPRPQEWFRLNARRTALHLQDGTVDGAALNPFGWIMHTHGKAKTGYLGRMGLFRTLVWPFIYKAYAVGDFAEFLETYGLPIIIGKYFAGASEDEKRSLMRAVTALGHDARAIMPQEMQLEVQKITGGGGDAAHLSMMSWAEKSISKSILGQTLSADTGGKGGGGSFALGKVHNEVRHDIRDSDARQLAATLTRDLIYPLIALNRPGIEGLKRCPRFVFDVSEAEDLTAYAEALPKLVGVGFKIPLAWAQEKLNIPQAKDDEAVLAVVEPVKPESGARPAPDDETIADLAAKAALSTNLNVAALPTATVDDASSLGAGAAPAMTAMIDLIKTEVDNAPSMAALQANLLNAFGGQPQAELAKIMALAFALAELKGISDVMDGQ